MKKPTDLLSIGQLSDRTGLSVSAIRFYETKKLVAPLRNAGGQRRFHRSDIRRLSFVMIAQQLGLPIRDIVTALAGLPEGRAPTQKDWTKISKEVRNELDRRIEALMRTRKNLDSCIGCGCLSLKTCALYNPDDKASVLGTGPHYAIGNRRAPDTHR